MVVFIDISEELQYGYEINRHEANDLIIKSVDRIAEVLPVHNQRALQHVVKNFVDTGTAITMVIKALFNNSSEARLLEEISYHLSTHVQRLYNYVEMDEHARITFVDQILDNAVTVNKSDDVEHIEYVLSDELMNWAAETLSLRPRRLDEMSNYLKEQCSIVMDFTEDNIVEIELQERLLVIR